MKDPDLAWLGAIIMGAFALGTLAFYLYLLGMVL